MTKDAKKNQAPKEFKIIISTQEGPGGERAVSVTCADEANPQGKVWNIPREKECWVPESVMKILERATQTRYIPIQKGNQMEMLSKKVKRFAYSVLESRQIKQTE